MVISQTGKVWISVNAHLDSIYRKLEVSNRAGAICTAVKLGITVPEI